MLEAKGLTKRYKNLTAVNNLELSLRDGELFSLLGINGAGKTTTVKMLSTLIKPTEGEILLDGKDVWEHKDEVRKIINISPQETAIAPNLTVLENLRFMAGVYSIDNPEETINKLTEDFKLDSVLKQKSKTLSGGWQRRLSIALALINDPKILFLDEPTLGLDVIARRELWQIIECLKSKKTIVLTTHYMEEAEALSDRVGIMSGGKLLYVDTPDALKALAKTDSFEDAFVKLSGGVR